MPNNTSCSRVLEPRVPGYPGAQIPGLNESVTQIPGLNEYPRPGYLSQIRGVLLVAYLGHG